jgi:hypothetical protein
MIAAEAIGIESNDPWNQSRGRIMFGSYGGSLGRLDTSASGLGPFHRVISARSIGS